MNPNGCYTPREVNDERVVDLEIAIDTVDNLIGRALEHMTSLPRNLDTTLAYLRVAQDQIRLAKES